jgi:hypothetical protein
MLPQDSYNNFQGPARSIAAGVQIKKLEALKRASVNGVARWLDVIHLAGKRFIVDFLLLI